MVRAVVTACIVGLHNALFPGKLHPWLLLWHHATGPCCAPAVVTRPENTRWYLVLGTKWACVSAL